MILLPSLFTLLILFSSLFIILLCIHMAVDDVASRTKTVVGHNLDPTPWHPFNKEADAHPLHVFHCSYLSCRLPTTAFPSDPADHNNKYKKKGKGKGKGKNSSSRNACPSFFRSSIHRDLEPWSRSGITPAILAGAQRHASMRIVIMGGRLYLDLYFACVQSRAMFTVWGLLQLLRRYPGRIPDVDILFDCMDRPTIHRSNYSSSDPPPLFRYCTTRDHLDIPFPDWSFWGWSEINIKPWDEEFRTIKFGSQAVPWKTKDATAYWKGNPDVQSPIRTALLSCNDTKMWGAQIMRQDWKKESSSGFKNSGLSSQCNHRYKIYAEGYAWSVSLKYILACGSLALIIDPQYEDFFTRGLVPKQNYWPISASNLCESVKSAVDWGNQHPIQAERIGKRGQGLMEELDMDRVYDYMYHLLVEYAKLQVFKPAPSPTAQEVCLESILCLANEKQRQLLESSLASSSFSPPCTI